MMMMMISVAYEEEEEEEEMITDMVWRDKRGGGDSCYHFLSFKIEFIP